MKVATAVLEDCKNISDLPVGSSLIPMSAFKQLERSCVFAIDDDYSNLKDFLWIGKRKNINGEEFTVFYCKRSFAEKLLEKIKDKDVEATEKFLNENMVNLEDYPSLLTTTNDKNKIREKQK